MTTYTYDENIFSDLHKDAYGFRPRGHEFYDATPARKQQLWDMVCEDLDVAMDEESRAQQVAIAELEEAIASNMKMGARNRFVAVQWILDAYDCLNDWGFGEYYLNVPYGYLQRSVNVWSV